MKNENRINLIIVIVVIVLVVGIAFLFLSNNFNTNEVFKHFLSLFKLKKVIKRQQFSFLSFKKL